MPDGSYGTGNATEVDSQNTSKMKVCIATALNRRHVARFTDIFKTITLDTSSELMRSGMRLLLTITLFLTVVIGFPVI